MTARHRKSQAKRRRHVPGPHRVANPELGWPDPPQGPVLTQWEILIVACVLGPTLLGVAFVLGWL